MASFKLEQNAYFLEAQRLAEEERKRRLLGIRPPESLISQQPSTSKADVKGRRSSGRITTGGLFGIKVTVRIIKQNMLCVFLLLQKLLL